MINIAKPNWDEPYKSKTILGKDILIGKSNDGNLIYLPSDINDPTKNTVCFCGSEEQKNELLLTNILNSVIGNKSIVIVSNNIKSNVYEIAKKNNYIIKEFGIENDTNHWGLFDFLAEQNAEIETTKFINRIKVSNNITNPTEHQINALNFLHSIILYVNYSKKSSLKDLKNYIIDYEKFEKDIKDLPITNYVRQNIEFAKNANNFFKWDISCLPEVYRLFIDKTAVKKVNTGGMSLSELQSEKCIYILHPSVVYSWVIPFVISYIYEINKSIDIFMDELPQNIPDFNSLICGDKRTFIVSNNIYDFYSYGNILSLFGGKIACHGCDIKAAKYLSDLSGINVGNNKFEGLKSPQEIVSRGQEKIVLFLLSAKVYEFKFADISYLKDVLTASLEGAERI